MPGFCLRRSLSMKMKFGGATQSNWVVPADWPTLVMFNSNNVPSPDNGVRSSEKAEIRSVPTL